MGNKLNPPIVDSKTVAQDDIGGLKIPFLMNRSVGWGNFEAMHLAVKSVQSNRDVVALRCEKEAIYFKNGCYWGIFKYYEDGEQKDLPLKKGQTYKAQLAYISKDGEIETIGFFSRVTTFKFTHSPIVYIENLKTNLINSHTYTYVGAYENENDPSEKVYSYQFNIYDNTNVLVASSGEQLHNVMLDTEAFKSNDAWTTNYRLEPAKNYCLEYSVKTINGLEKTSLQYKIQDGTFTVPSTILDHYDFTAINNEDNAYIELILKSNSSEKKIINGKFVILRSSSEDNFSSWNELTRFTLAGQDSRKDKFLCKDYCVSQGVTYQYGIQAYNSEGLYSDRSESNPVTVDFEDIFLSDGKRQLKIKFNPKISSFKNTILETKLDTLGGKYPFFFRNGNVKYKEFPISGLISVQMDADGEFIENFASIGEGRDATPTQKALTTGTSSDLTGENYGKERAFKLEVLEWLTNGKPKLFRSPSEGSYLVRLMNTSLTPNDTLGRMIHTFSSTAYEIDDLTFENLRKYDMTLSEEIETRDLVFEKICLSDPLTGGKATNLHACTATVVGEPFITFFCTFQDDPKTYSFSIPNTGVFEFPKSVLNDTPLEEIWHGLGVAGWRTGSYLYYSKYIDYETDYFSYIHSINIEDKISQWIGSMELDDYLYEKDPNKILKSMGLVYYLNVQKRPIIEIDKADEQINNTYKFFYGDVEYHAANDEILKDISKSPALYYDGKTKKLIGLEKDLDFTFQLRDTDDPIDLKGIEIDTVINQTIIPNCASVANVGGRIVLTSVSDVHGLKAGNGVVINIAYQEINCVYSIEKTDIALINAKLQWELDKLQASYWAYYYLLVDKLDQIEGRVVIGTV